MKSVGKDLSRRELLLRGSWLSAGAIATAFPSRLLAQTPLMTVDLVYAGSMGSLMDGSLKAAAGQALKLDVRGRGQGANALADAIAGGSIRPDVFLPVTAGPMLVVMRAGKAEVAQPIARTEVVIVYSPKSRFAPRFDAAAKGKDNWWEILQEPGMRFGRSNPSGDPGGRSIVFTMMLAARKYKQANLVEKVLGPTMNSEQIVAGKSTTARLLSGELDAGSAYKIQPGTLGLPYITLPKDIDLSSQSVHLDNPDVSLSIAGESYNPEPLVYYAAILKDAANPEGAAAFTQWLKSDDAQAIFRRYQYDPSGEAPILHA
jgi:molybdate/tungstate transport system substrate-binding protein